MALGEAGEAGRDVSGFELVLLQNVGLVDRHAPDRTERISASLAYQLGMYSALHAGDDTPGHGFRAREVAPSTVAASALWGTPQQVAAGLAELVRRPARPAAASSCCGSATREWTCPTPCACWSCSPPTSCPACTRS
jgi:hypothetical protein